LPIGQNICLKMCNSILVFTVILSWLVRCRYLEEEKDVASKGPKKIEISYKIHDEKTW